MATAVKGVAQSVDRDVPIAQIRTLDDVLSASLAQPRLYTALLGVFAALALTLAAVGLYGVVSYTVAQRTHEMGIRLALGAERGALIRVVLRQALGLARPGPRSASRVRWPSRGFSRTWSPASSRAIR